MMRAVWVPEINDTEFHVINGETCHHLANVLRIQPDDELILLDGKGRKLRTRVKSINKKETVLLGLKDETVERATIMDLALGIPKKESLELCLKEATELGFRRVYLIKAAYSQIKLPEMSRIHRILVSALEQSNAAFLPQIIETSWGELPWGDYGMTLMMDSQTRHLTKVAGDLIKPVLLIVGPEGGFDSAELAYLHERPCLEVLHLPTPILRTPTALATGAGCLLHRLMDRS